MTTTTEPRNVPLPAGAAKVHDWCDIGSRDTFREFEGTSWSINPDTEDAGRPEVVILGSQLASGEVEGLHVHVYGSNLAELSADRARQFGHALLAAADERAAG